MSALRQLEEAYAALRHDPRFWAELRELLQRYAGRPTALYRADRLAYETLERAIALEGRTRLPHRLRLHLKREDLAHTGAHKINNALGQALLTRRLGKTRVIAETGAGQHGVATATACALLGLPCVVYMGAEDIERQQPNVLRMHALGTEVRPVTSGSATLKDAINEAMRDWVTNVETTHYVLGSAMGPHPYPTIVRDLQRRIGDEAAAQFVEVEGRLPDLALACVGGGSNAIGLLDRFIGEPSVRLAVAEAAGDGIATGRHAAALAGGTPGILHGARSMMLQDRDGQVTEAHSASAGLDYPGVGPQIAALARAGRLEISAATDDEAFEAMRWLARTEGILPALESAHALATLPRLLAGTEGAGGDWPEEAASCSGCPGAATRTSRRSGAGTRRTSRERRGYGTVCVRHERDGGRASHRHCLRRGLRRRARGPHPVRRRRLPGRGDELPGRPRGHRRGRRPPRARPAVLGSAGRWRDAPARVGRRPRKRRDARWQPRPDRADCRGSARDPARADGLRQPVHRWRGWPRGRSPAGDSRRIGRHRRRPDP